MSDQTPSGTSADFSGPISYERPAGPKPGFVAPLLWAVFLGVSWTWVIGMFLPVLLVRDYGAWAWAVFAAPNVIGAAAMGWVLRDAGGSERFVERHGAACRAFSVVTIAFHLFFAAWMIQRIGGPGGAGAGFALAVPLAASVLFLLMRGRVGRWAVAGLAFVISLLMWNQMYGQGALAMPSAEPIRSGAPAHALAYIAPVFILGFALNPYLDLTFHRARLLTSPAGGRVAFGVGFGLVFLSMIVFTLLYARFLYPAVEGHPLSRVMATYLLIHLTAQSAFTIAAHLGELPDTRRRDVARPQYHGGAVTVALLLLVIAPALGHYASTPRTFRGHDLGEVVYWCFLGFYGLVFPGYIWLCAIPGKDQSTPPQATGRAVVVLAAMVIVAFPMYWMGFIEGRHVWLAPGLLVLLGSRLLVRGGASPRASRGAE